MFVPIAGAHERMAAGASAEAHDLIVNVHARLFLTQYRGIL